MDKKSVGPSYLDIAKKYRNNLPEQERIAKKIITGGSGVWGEHAMSAHPQLSEQDAALMVDYIMSFNNGPKITEVIPLSGTYVPKVPEGDNGRGGFLLRVAYKDKGTSELGSLTSEKIIALRNPVIDPEKADVQEGTQLLTTPRRSFNMVGDNAHLGFKKIDLSGISQIEFLAQAQPRVGATGGIIEVRLGTPDGKLIGQTELIKPKDMGYREAIAILTKQNEEKVKSGELKEVPPIDNNAVGRIMSTQAVAALEAVEGIHDVYFVFRNPEAKAGQILVQMEEIAFQNKASIAQ